eukprot:SAG22_NODE_4714_length_1182_cov_3.371191_2_plen_115_part_00
MSCTGNSRNSSDKPRQVCYLTMFPPESDSTFKAARHFNNGNSWSTETERQRRVKIWELGLHVASFDETWDPATPLELPHGGGGSFGGKRVLEQRASPVLSELGKRLLGLKPCAQ